MKIIELISGCPDDARYICIEDSQHLADLLKLLRRGLNTWPSCPMWLVDLQAELSAMEAKDGQPQV